jgi:hypothetical protein
MKSLLGGKRQAAGLGDRDEIAEVSKFHRPYLQGMTRNL